MDEIGRDSPEHLAQLRSNFARVREIIQAEEMWERVPEWAREFSPENLEGLVKFAYFGGFIDTAGVRRLLLVDKTEIHRPAPQVVRRSPGTGLLALLKDGFQLKNLRLWATRPAITPASPQIFELFIILIFFVF